MPVIKQHPPINRNILPWDNYHAGGTVHPYRDRYTGHIHYVFPCQPLDSYPLGFFDDPSGPATGLQPIFAWDDIPPEAWEIAEAFNRKQGTHVDYYQMPRPKRDPDYSPREIPYRDRYTGEIRLICPEEPIGRYPLGHFDGPNPPGPRGEPIYRWDDIPNGWSPDAPENGGGDTVSPPPVAQLTLFGKT